MKYLFLNSVAGFGSTGRIVAELAREKQAQGHDCLIAYGRDNVGCGDIPTVRIGSDLDFKLHGVLNRLLDDHGFDSKAATRGFLKKVQEYDPDVIWLHNIHGYYLHIGLLFDYLRTCGKEIRWTLHDCWAFTGHCAYFDFVRCDRWKTGCHDCPQKKEYPASLLLDNSRKNQEAKKALFTGIPNMKLIVPSNWLAGRVKQSFLGQYPVEVVYNKIDRDVFKPSPSDFREKHGLENKTVLLGVASIWERRKGLDDLIALHKLLDDRFRMVIVGLTPEQMQAVPEGILCLPRTKTVGELAEIYSAADFYLNPSVEETFGMTAMEALNCGTLPIVYRDTACEEIVNLFGGEAVERGPENLYRAIMARMA
jgi:glycosyltransferase involved in cell wall biosynthesis